jgi:hypothetical protein
MRIEKDVLGRTIVLIFPTEDRPQLVPESENSVRLETERRHISGPALRFLLDEGGLEIQAVKGVCQVSVDGETLKEGERIRIPEQSRIILGCGFGIPVTVDVETWRERRR